MNFPKKTPKLLKVRSYSKGNHINISFASVLWGLETAAGSQMVLTFKELTTALDVLKSRGAGGNAIAMDGFTRRACVTGSRS